MRLTFASYNIHKAVGTDGRRDADRIISVLRELDADVIALQEVDRRIGERATVLSRAALDDTRWQVVPVAKRPRSIGWHGNALLVRREFEVLAAEPLDLPTLEPRGAVSATIRHKNRTFCIVGTHLDLSGLRRRDQVRTILAHIARQKPTIPSVVMGDFNQWGGRSGAMREFAGDWQVLSLGRSFPSRQPIARFDRIVATGDWDCADHGVHHSALATRASDHLPVFAKLSLPDN